MAKLNLTWGETQHVAKDRVRWGQGEGVIVALRPTGKEED